MCSRIWYSSCTWRLGSAIADWHPGQMGPDDESIEDCCKWYMSFEWYIRRYKVTSTYSTIPDERELDLAFARSTSDDKVVAVLVSLCI